MQKQIDELITTISDKFEEQLKQKEDELLKAIEEKKQKEQQIDDKIKSLEDIKLQIQTIANNTIFKESK
jgi:ATP-dependent protease HslVU (ClpYQ) peptidase subunit